MPHRSYTILDTRGLMLRYFHSSPRPAGQTEGGNPLRLWEEGLYEMLNREILPLLTDNHLAPSQVIAAWDGGNMLRKSLFENYKKTRLEKEGDPEIKQQIKTLKKKLIDVLAYLGIKSVHVPGEEADDLIALLCDRLQADHIVVRTIDNDLAQLVSPKVSVWVSDSFYQHTGEFKDGLPFSLIALNKALVGDSSDEYRGVNGLGKQKFKHLLKAYGADGLLEIQAAMLSNDWSPVQGAYEATKDQSLKMLLEHWSEARLCLNLAQLHPEACYGNFHGNHAKRPVWVARVPSREKVLEIFTEAGIGQEIEKYSKFFPENLLAAPSNYEQLVELGSQIQASPIVSWDYESTDTLKHEPFKEAKKRGGGTYVDVLSQQISGVSVNFGPYMEKTVYLPVDHAGEQNFPIDWLKWLLSVIDARPDRSVVHNANFELTLSKTNLDMLPAAPYDTTIMSSYVDENEEAGLKKLSLRYLGYHQASYEETTQGRDMRDLTGEEVLSYGCDDSLVTSHLFELFRAIMQLEGSWDFYRENEMDPVQEDVLDFVDGQDIDYAELERQSQAAKETIEQANERMRMLLEEHAPTADRAYDEKEIYRRALLLFEEWFAVERTKAEGDPEGEQEIREKVWAKAWNACFYQPFEQHTEIPEFASTPTQLNKVIKILDPNAPLLKKANGPGVDEFEVDLMSYAEGPKGPDDEVYEKLNEFMKLLYGARKKLGPASRSGVAYAALADFCAPLLTGNPEGNKVLKTGSELNTNSSPQMQALLYGMLGLPIRRRSKVDKGSTRDIYQLKGAPATGLKAIAAAFVYDLDDETDWRRDLLMGYRDVARESQNVSLYYTALPLWAHPRDGRIHPQVRNCGTVTRRPAGNDPNVLQVSKRDDAKIRQLYLPGDYGDGERVVVSADFANQELVITACESKDPVMLDAFMATPRKDLHSVTSLGFAHLLMPRLTGGSGGERMDYEAFQAARSGESGEVLKKATTEIRNKYGKAVAFLIVYGGGYTTLAENLLIPADLARELMQATFSMYERLKPWQQEVIAFARENGFSQTAYGNRRHASADLWSNDDFLRSRMERQVINATVQGTAADILKEARQRMHDRKLREKYHTRATKPVYDEITASVPIDAVPDYCAELIESMEITPPGYEVGMKVDLSIGNTWGNQVELKGTSREEIEQVLEALRAPTESAK